VTPPATSTRTPTSTPTAILAASAFLFLVLTARAADPEGTLARAGDELVARLASGNAEPGLVALVVSAPGAQALAGPLETAICAALARRGFSAAPLRGLQLVDAEATARGLGADRLLRVSAGLSPGRSELSLTAEDLPTRPSFFLQHSSRVRPGGGRLWSLALPADPGTLVFARAPPRSQAAALAMRPLFQVSDRILALAVGDPAGDGSIAIAIVTPLSISLHGPTGALLARRDLEPGARVRHPAATVAIGDFPGGRIALQLAGGKPGEILAFGNGAMRPVAPLAAAPLAVVGRLHVFGAFLPARATFADFFAGAPAPGAQPRSGRELVAFAAAPRPGRIAFAALYDDGALQLLGADLVASTAPLAGVGAGFALADLDGDGEPELVASSAEPGPNDRIRVLRLAPGGAELVFESKPVPGSVLAGAASDVTGDGLDDAVLASVMPSGDSQILLVTADPRLTSGAGGSLP
jgi:hypothetical protein